MSVIHYKAHGSAYSACGEACARNGTEAMYRGIGGSENRSTTDVEKATCSSCINWLQDRFRAPPPPHPDLPTQVLAQRILFRIWSLIEGLGEASIAVDEDADVDHYENSRGTEMSAVKLVMAFPSSESYWNERFSKLRARLEPSGPQLMKG